MNRMLSSAALADASSFVTCLAWLCHSSGLGGGQEGTNRLSDKSALLPTNTIITSLPRSDFTSSIHLDVERKDARSKGSK